MKTHATNEQDTATFAVASQCGRGLHLIGQGARTRKVNKSNQVLKKRSSRDSADGRLLSKPGGMMISMAKKGMCTEMKQGGVSFCYMASNSRPQDTHTSAFCDNGPSLAGGIMRSQQQIAMKSLSASRILAISTLSFLLFATAHIQNAFAQAGSRGPDALPTSYRTQEDFTYKLIPGANNTWGYEVIVNKRVLVHQPTVPGVPGNEGFKTKEAAEKVAKLVIEKIRSGMIPPAVSLEELKKMNVL